MKGTIDFTWIDQNRQYNKKLNKADLYAVFHGLLDGFADDNGISKVFIEEIIPSADKIMINKDYNATQDVPAIYYSIDGDCRILKIIRYHKIIWAILDKYCTE